MVVFVQPLGTIAPGYLLAQQPISVGMDANLTVSPIRRLAYALLGLLAGDAILFVILLQNALRVRAMLLVAHIGDPANQVPLALEMFALYSVFSFAGWLLVGLPIALFVPARALIRWSWLTRVLVGAALGPLALFATIVLLAHGHVDFQSFTHMGALWVYSILVSTFAFSIYVALLTRKRLAGNI